MDRFTPCTSRPTEVYARRMNSTVHGRTGYHHTVLHHFSTFLEHQESRISQLMRNFDIDLEGDVSYDRVDNIDLDASPSSGSFGNMVPSSPLKFPPALQQDEPHSSQASTQLARPGRLSPSIIQTILSSNTSTVSGISSAADTSYDSGLYQWLGVEMAAPGSSSIPATSSEKFDDTSNLDLSMMSSRGAFSQPPPKSRIVLPISPPATAVPPFSNTLGEEATGDSFPRSPDLVPHHLDTIESGEIPLRDFIPSMLSNNLSLQHYIPSALVLSHFQEVIDELRGLYVPNDTRNNTPNPYQKQAFLPSLRSLPILSPSRLSHRRSSSHNPLNSATAIQSSAVLHPSPAADNNTYRSLKTTRELYTEMAVMLFTQVSNEEAQVTNLRNLVNKLEMLAIKKRKVALVIGERGLGR